MPQLKVLLLMPCLQMWKAAIAAISGEALLEAANESMASVVQLLKRASTCTLRGVWMPARELRLVLPVTKEGDIVITGNRAGTNFATAFGVPASEKKDAFKGLAASAYADAKEILRRLRALTESDRDVLFKFVTSPSLFEQEGTICDPTKLVRWLLKLIEPGGVDTGQAQLGFYERTSTNLSWCARPSRPSTTSPELAASTSPSLSAAAFPPPPRQSWLHHDPPLLSNAAFPRSHAAAFTHTTCCRRSFRCRWTPALASKLTLMNIENDSKYTTSTVNLTLLTPERHERAASELLKELVTAVQKLPQDIKGALMRTSRLPQPPKEARTPPRPSATAKRARPAPSPATVPRPKKATGANATAAARAASGRPSPTHPPPPPAQTRPPRKHLVGQRVSIRWCGAPGKPWFDGTIKEYDAANHKHLVHYDDNDVKWHSLAEEDANGQLRML